MLCGRVAVAYILLMNSYFVLSSRNLMFQLSSKLCFQVIKPFREMLFVHYDRNFLLDGGIPDELRGGIYFQGPHKVVGKTHFNLVVRDQTMDELSDNSYLYIFFHKTLKFSGCLHHELSRKNFYQVEGPGVPYDVTHGKHGVPSELWYTKLRYNNLSKKASVEFQINTNEKCPFCVFGAIFTSNITNFGDSILRAQNTGRCPKRNYFRSFKKNKVIRFTVRQAQ